MNGKGDKHRPINDYKKYRDNFDLIFGKKKENYNENDKWTILPNIEEKPSMYDGLPVRVDNSYPII